MRTHTLAMVTALALGGLVGCASEAAPRPVSLDRAVETVVAGGSSTEAPAACVDALAAADDVMAITTEGMRAAGAMVAEVPNIADAVLANNPREIDRITGVITEETATLKRLTDEANASNYAALRDECLSKR